MGDRGRGVRSDRVNGVRRMSGASDPVRAKAGLTPDCACVRRLEGLACLVRVSGACAASARSSEAFPGRGGRGGCRSTGAGRRVHPRQHCGGVREGAGERRRQVPARRARVRDRARKPSVDGGALRTAASAGGQRSPQTGPASTSLGERPTTCHLGTPIQDLTYHFSRLGPHHPSPGPLTSHLSRFLHRLDREFHNVIYTNRLVREERFSVPHPYQRAVVRRLRLHQLV